MGEEFVDQHDYQILVGSLISFTHTRLDLSFVVNYVNKYMYVPQRAHMDATKRILCYIWRTSEYGMTLKHSQNGLQLVDFVDVDWGCDLDKWKSIIEMIFKLNDNMISYSSKLQPTIALSTKEMEYQSLVDGVK